PLRPPSLPSFPTRRSSDLHMLPQSGARALVAGREGPLVSDLKAYGGEWIPFKPDSVNPLTRRRNDSLLARLVGSERIDIIHAQRSEEHTSELQSRSDLVCR